MTFNKKIINTSFFAVFLISVFSLVSCKSMKNNIKTEPVTNINSKKSELIDSVLQASLDYKTMKIKFGSEYITEEQNISIDGRISILRDSFIHVTLSPGMGIELARVLLTKDSVKFINRLKSEYFIGDYKFFKDKFGVDFDYFAIQSLITNKFFTYPNQSDVKSGLELYLFTNDSVSANFTKQINQTDKHQILINNKNYTITEIIAKYAQNNITLRYDNFIDIQGKLFPTVLNAEITGKTGKTNFNLNYQKVTLNEEVSPSFKIGDNYTQIKF